jgi:SAM-dependent methyltransferase
VPYDDARAWAAGPERVYRRLAAAAVELLPLKLSGALVVDAGAGTGAASRELRRRGAHTLAVDISAPMVALAPAPAVVGDICRMPLRANAADACVACLVLSHVQAPEVALHELARVARLAVVATAFPAGASHPVKEAVDRVIAAWGYRAPDWYTEMKSDGERRVGSPGALEALAHRAGLTAEVTRVEVPLDGLDAAALTQWRLGMAQTAHWLSTLDPTRAEEVTAQIRTAVELTPAPPLPLLILAARTQSAL